MSPAPPDPVHERLAERLYEVWRRDMDRYYPLTDRHGFMRPRPRWELMDTVPRTTWRKIALQATEEMHKLAI